VLGCVSASCFAVKAVCSRLHAAPLLGHVTGLTGSADAVRLVEKVIPVAQRRLGILIDRDDDRLHMRVAPTFARGLDADFRKRVYPRRVVHLLIVPLQRLAYAVTSALRIFPDQNKNRTFQQAATGSAGPSRPYKLFERASSLPWSTEFDDPIVLPDGRQLLTLKDAADYITELPKRNPTWRSGKSRWRR
jgi:hypothetical protein